MKKEGLRSTKDALPPDPLIDELRAIRTAISHRFHNDVDELFAHVKKLEAARISGARKVGTKTGRLVSGTKRARK